MFVERSKNNGIKIHNFHGEHVTSRQRGKVIRGPEVESAKKAFYNHSWKQIEREKKTD